MMPGHDREDADYLYINTTVTKAETPTFSNPMVRGAHKLVVNFNFTSQVRPLLSFIQWRVRDMTLRQGNHVGVIVAARQGERCALPRADPTTMLADVMEYKV